AIDRLEAATLKEIERLCQKDELASAEALIEAIRLWLPRPEDRWSFEISAYSLVARSAVRVGDWPRALRTADRYARVERDPIEAARFVAWVETRQPRPDIAAPASELYFFLPFE